MRNGLIYTILLSSILLAGCVSQTGTAGVPYVFAPGKGDKYPGIIVLHTKDGLADYIVRYAQSLSQEGPFVTAVVNYFTRGGVDNIEVAYDLLARHPNVDPNKIGLVGFSKGAKQAVEFSYYSHHFTKRRVHAIVSYYPGPSAGSSSEKHPPILILIGDLDEATIHVNNFCAVQTALGTSCNIQTYKGVGHAFNWYLPNESRDAFRRTVRFLNVHLRGAVAN